MVLSVFRLRTGDKATVWVAALMVGSAGVGVGCGDPEASGATPTQEVDASDDVLTAADAGLDTQEEVQQDAREENEPDGPADDADGGVALTWTACDTSNWADGYPKPALGVECTTVGVALDRAHPDAGTIALRVARHKSKAGPTGRAVFQLAGGPGGGSVYQSGIIPWYMPELRDEFDLIYVDQRGTGESGYLDCAEEYPEHKQQWVSCGQQHADDALSHFGTVDAAHDLDDVRAALGYDKIHLRGGSYGTRLGLEYLRQHGDRVAAAVLDGLVPPDYPLFEEVIQDFDWGVNRLISDCKQSASCTSLSPTLSADLTARRLELRANPRPIKVNGSSYVEDETLYLTILRFTIADSYWRFSVPHAVHAAASGENSRWNALMSDVFGAVVTDTAPSSVKPLRLPRPITRGASYVAPGLYAAIACSEFLPLSGGVNALQMLAEQQTWGNDSTDYSIIGLARACPQWNIDALDASLLQPVSSDAKVLLLSGDIDMTTRPEWGARALATLPNATHIVVPYATHATMVVPCVGEVITRFLEADGEIQQVDASCVGQLTEPPWY